MAKQKVYSATSEPDTPALDTALPVWVALAAADAEDAEDGVPDVVELKEGSVPLL
jgi:hypothetical protein